MDAAAEEIDESMDTETRQTFDQEYSESNLGKRLLIV